MKDLIDDLTVANQNYRQKLYDCLVGFYGIAEGALVMIRRDGRGTSASSEKQLAIIQSIDWDSLNITLDCNTRPFCGDFSMEVVVDGKTITSNTPFWFWVEEDEGKSTKLKEFIQQNTYDDRFQILEVLSQSNEKPSENWFMEGYDNCWKWVCKNRSLSEIGSTFADLIEKWCPILKAKRGLEARLKRYRKK